LPGFTLAVYYKDIRKSQICNEDYIKGINYWWGNREPETFYLYCL